MGFCRAHPLHLLSKANKRRDPTYEGPIVSLFLSVVQRVTDLRKFKQPVQSLSPTPDNRFQFRFAILKVEIARLRCGSGHLAGAAVPP
jgi:hypothetical protein